MRPQLCLLLVLLRLSVPLFAHDDRPQPVVSLDVVPSGSALSVTARLPLAALSEANLPRNADRSPDLAAVDGPLQLVAREIAAGYEFAQDGERLPFPLVRVSLSADRSAVELALSYVIQPDHGPLSARLAPFRAPPDRVPVAARFVVDAHRSRTFLVSRAPEVVVFNPTVRQTIVSFIGRAAEVFANDWLTLLFVLALVFPRRSAPANRAHLTALLIAQAVGATYAAAGMLSAAAAPIAVAIAASLVVITSLTGVAAPSRSLVALATVFGLLNGLALGVRAHALSPHAGDYAAAGLGVFTITVLLGQAWLIVVLGVMRDLLDRSGVPVRATAIAVAAYVCHSALHELLERTSEATPSWSFSVESSLLALTLLWTAMLIGIGAVGARRTIQSA